MKMIKRVIFITHTHITIEYYVIIPLIFFINITGSYFTLPRLPFATRLFNLNILKLVINVRLNITCLYENRKY